MNVQSSRWVERGRLFSTTQGAQAPAETREARAAQYAVAAFPHSLLLHWVSSKHTLLVILMVIAWVVLRVLAGKRTPGRVPIRPLQEASESSLETPLPSDPEAALDEMVRRRDDPGRKAGQ